MDNANQAQSENPNLNLTVGDRVTRNMGAPGSVAGFRTNAVTGAHMVLIRWDDATQDQGYTDGERIVMGIKKSLSSPCPDCRIARVCPKHCNGCNGLGQIHDGDEWQDCGDCEATGLSLKARLAMEEPEEDSLESLLTPSKPISNEEVRQIIADGVRAILGVR